MARPKKIGAKVARVSIALSKDDRDVVTAYAEAKGQPVAHLLQKHSVSDLLRLARRWADENAPVAV